ncbi:hypothetical protein H0H92_010361 [Tricholoma furcatifolium]|nr:hypothetical protein H0H92_010361 [Tricholoma furcatifolium]
MLNKDDYFFFWRPGDKNGWAGQWYPSRFTGTISINGENRKVLFVAAEQWMMVQKALLFGDTEIAEQLLAIEDSSPASMRKVMALGRKVKGFDEETWVCNRERIVLEGNMLKFGQSDKLRKLLIETGDRRLIEASPLDRIWGIGYAEEDAFVDTENWGLNLLGRALEETRQRLSSKSRLQS